MSPLKTLKAGVCLSALVAGQSAFADVTAQDVWDNWQSTLGLYGEDGVTIGSEEMSGDTLTVSGLMLSMRDDDTSMSADIGDLMFTENGDGTVTVTLPETSTISFVDEFGASGEMSTSQSGMSIVASGTLDELSYDVSADQYTISVDNIDDPSEGTSGNMRFTLNDLTGNYLVATRGELRDLTYAFATSSADILVDVTDSLTDDAIAMSGQMNGLFLNAALTLPADMDIEDPEEFFTNDFAISATYGLTGATYLGDLTDSGESGSISGTTGATDTSFEFSSAGVSYSGSFMDVAMNLMGPDMPFPIDVSVAEYGFGLEIPLSRTDAPEAFGLRFNITELAVNDEFWMLGDPTGAIPHDPVTVRLDIAGTGKLLVDLMDPAQMAMVNQGEMMPVEVYTLDLNDLTISAAGADVDGAGGFTFDNSDLTTIPGVPRPEGEITVNINGANKLIDSLVAMGLVPEDQAMMGRMMMGMFARTVGEDQLTSTIEINDQGHILANGQRIQ